MKYILAKNLPFAKKGKKILIQNGSFMDSCYIERDHNHANLSQVFLGTKEDLLKDGWIEEVKPREEYFIYNETLDNYHYKSFSSFELAAKVLSTKPTESYKYKIFKFIEVIE